MTHIVRRTRRTASALTLTALVVALASPSGAPASAAPAPAGLDPALVGVAAAEQVVVSGATASAARAALLAVGADRLRSLPIIDGWSARVPAGRLAALAAAPGVVAVTKDREVAFTGGAWDTSVSASPHAWNTQATSLWADGRKGTGVTVAVLDTGVSHVPDLAGRLMPGPDLSGEGDNTTDSFGHGTVMAGIIGGSGAASGSQPRTGIAPAATVLSVKLAGRNGASDVSTVLAGLSWVGAFKDTYDIKVLNLSWGVPSTQNPSIDPVNFAVERLWTLGVTVVVAAGNAGPNAATILKPGDDPLVITVGAYDEHGNSAVGDDSIPAWSSQGPTAQGRAKPDLVAPGRTIVATRAPGSFIEQMNPNALVEGGYIKGSGTSQATAVVSGLAALILQAHPTWTPDQVKKVLTSTAVPLTNVPVTLQGAGRVQGQAASDAFPGLPIQQVAVSSATGTLAASRGSSTPITISCAGQPVVLTGEVTSWCAPWSGAAWTSGAWTSGAWTSGAWTSGAWTSGAWTSGAWTSGAWTSGAWTSGAWTSGAWTSGAWTSGAWTSYDENDGSAEPAPQQTPFLTAFYGDGPKPGLRIAGEVTEFSPGKALGRL